MSRLSHQLEMARRHRKMACKAVKNYKQNVVAGNDCGGTSVGGGYGLLVDPEVVMVVVVWWVEASQNLIGGGPKCRRR